MKAATRAAIWDQSPDFLKLAEAYGAAGLSHSKTSVKWMTGFERRWPLIKPVFIDVPVGPIRELFIP